MLSWFGEVFQSVPLVETVLLFIILTLVIMPVDWWATILGGPWSGSPKMVFHYSGLENSMHCIVHGVAKSWTQLSDFDVGQSDGVLMGWFFWAWIVLSFPATPLSDAVKVLLLPKWGLDIFFQSMLQTPCWIFVLQPGKTHASCSGSSESSPLDLQGSFPVGNSCHLVQRG